MASEQSLWRTNTMPWPRPGRHRTTIAFTGKHRVYLFEKRDTITHAPKQLSFWSMITNIWEISQQKHSRNEPHYVPYDAIPCDINDNDQSEIFTAFPSDVTDRCKFGDLLWAKFGEVTICTIFKEDNLWFDFDFKYAGTQRCNRYFFKINGVFHLFGKTNHFKWNQSQSAWKSFKWTDFYDATYGTIVYIKSRNQIIKFGGLLKFKHFDLCKKQWVRIHISTLDDKYKFMNVISAIPTPNNKYILILAQWWGDSKYFNEFLILEYLRDEEYRLWKCTVDVPQMKRVQYLVGCTGGTALTSGYIRSLYQTAQFEGAQTVPVQITKLISKFTDPVIVNLVEWAPSDKSIHHQTVIHRWIPLDVVLKNKVLIGGESKVTHGGYPYEIHDDKS